MKYSSRKPAANASMNNAITPAAQANARDTATPSQPGFRSASFRATKYETPTPTNIASNVGAIGDPLIVGGATLRYYWPRRNPTSTPCEHHRYRAWLVDARSGEDGRAVASRRHLQPDTLARRHGRTRADMGRGITIDLWRRMERKKSVIDRTGPRLAVWPREGSASGCRKTLHAPGPAPSVLPSNVSVGARVTALLASIVFLAPYGPPKFTDPKMPPNKIIVREKHFSYIRLPDLECV